MNRYTQDDVDALLRSCDPQYGAQIGALRDLAKRIEYLADIREPNYGMMDRYNDIAAVFKMGTEAASTGSGIYLVDDIALARIAREVVRLRGAQPTASTTPTEEGQ